MLTLGPGRQQHSFSCECCNAPIDRSWCMVYADDAPYALYYASCYHHLDQDHDAWIDVVFGTWGMGVQEMADHVSFGCRVGPIAGQALPAASLVNAAEIYPDGPVFGRKLDRESALQHSRLAEFWAVVDFVLESDALVHVHIYGARAARGAGLLTRGNGTADAGTVFLARPS